MYFQSLVAFKMTVKITASRTFITTSALWIFCFKQTFFKHASALHLRRRMPLTESGTLTPEQLGAINDFVESRRVRQQRNQRPTSFPNVIIPVSPGSLSASETGYVSDGASSRSVNPDHTSIEMMTFDNQRNTNQYRLQNQRSSSLSHEGQSSRRIVRRSSSLPPHGRGWQGFDHDMYAAEFPASRGFRPALHTSNSRAVSSRRNTVVPQEDPVVFSVRDVIAVTLMLKKNFLKKIFG